MSTFQDDDSVGLAPPTAERSASVAVMATGRLREALERAADALAEGCIEGLLASEGALEFALAELPPVDRLDADERTALRDELLAAERALFRCRRLGATLADYVRLTLAAQSAGSTDYTASGREDTDFAGRTVNARV